MDRSRDEQRPRIKRVSIDGFLAPTPRRSTGHTHHPTRPIADADKAHRVVRKSSEPRPSPVTSKSPPSLLNTTIAASGSAEPRQYQFPNKKRGRLNKRKVAALFVLLVLFTLIGVTGFLGTRLFATLDKVFHGSILSDIGAAFESVQLKGQSSGRVNILLGGDSSDQLGHGGANLTDSILILSIDTQNHTAFLLSIPRDLWVDIPGFGWQKINAANDNMGTNFPGFPQNGMGQLEHLVVTDLGIPIDYYALADYGAFQDAVNAVGGVTVTINSPDPRGLYDPNVSVRLPNGPATLNGQQALNLARARGDGPGSYGFPDSDFDRTTHQRQIFTAVAEKAKSLGFLTNPVKISNLFSAFGNNVATDLSLQDVLALVNLSKSVNLNNIKSYSYCSTLTVGQNGCINPILTGYVDPATREDALIPKIGIGNYSQMQQYYQQLTTNNPVVKEGASVVVLNGTNTSGVAKNAQTTLESKGISVTAIADASKLYATTTIIDNSAGKDPATLALLKSLYGNNVTTQQLETNPTNPTFIVIIGSSSTTSATNTSQ